MPLRPRRSPASRRPHPADSRQPAPQAHRQ
jgi:hypothetical protein